ncbi:MAG: YigZ family protein [Chloroflexi bacterium]|nr:YigZ family protein [Chloroflexota bacterium]
MEQFDKLIPLEAVETEIMVVNSRFIASLAPVGSVEQAREFVSEVKKRFPDASHHVPAFVIGHGRSVITHCTDDGEPSGTAGRPALAVLQGSGLGNVVVVITRYFGGTKLGTGGLVKAYGDAVREVLKGVKIAALLPTTTIMFVTPYRLYDQVARLMESHQGQVLETEFMEEVTVTVKFMDDLVEAFTSDLSNLSAGQVETIVVEQNHESVFPIADSDSQ